MADVSRGLTLMSGELRTAHKQAESPAETDDHDQALSGAAKGAVFGAAGHLVGGLLGHQQDKAEQEKAHQRMVNVVAELAAGYDLSAYGRVVPPPPPHPDIPGTTTRDSTPPRSGPGASTPTAAPTTSGLAGQLRRRHRRGPRPAELRTGWRRDRDARFRAPSAAGSRAAA